MIGVCLEDLFGEMVSFGPMSAEEAERLADVLNSKKDVKSVKATIIHDFKSPPVKDSDLEIVLTD